MEDPEPTAAGEVVVHEVQGPAGVRLGFHQDRRPRPYGSAAPLALAHAPSLLAIEPVDAVLARGFAHLAQQHEQPSIAEPPALGRQRMPPFPQLRLRRAVGSIADRGPIRLDDGAGPPLAHLEHPPKMSDAFALGSGPYHFFATSSFGAALSI
jgi:hypothetical protein